MIHAFIAASLLFHAALGAGAAAPPPAAATPAGSECPTGTPPLARARSPRFVLGSRGEVHVGAGEAFSFSAPTSGVAVVHVQRMGRLERVACGPVEERGAYRPASDSALAEAETALVSFYGVPDALEARRSSLLDVQRVRVLQGEVARVALSEDAGLAGLKGAALSFVAGASRADDLQKQILGTIEAIEKAAPPDAELEEAFAAQQRLARDRVLELRVAVDRRDEDGWGPVLAAARALPEPVGPADVLTSCTSLRVLKWYASSSNRLLLRAELPIGARPVTLSFGGAPTRAAAFEGERVAVVLAGVPTGEKLSANFQYGSAVPSIPDTIARFIGALPGAVAMSADDLRPRGEAPPCDEPLADGDAEPVSPLMVRSVVLTPATADFQSTAVVCAAATCNAAKDDSSVRNRVTLDVWPRRRLTLLAEFAGTIPTQGRASLGRSRFEAIGGAAGPDQLFELRTDADARQSFSTSVLLGGQHRRWLFAAGPSLWLGTGGAGFSQWNVRFGAFLTRGVALTAGPSFRVVRRPTDHREGAVVAVPRTATGDAPPPPLRLRDEIAVGLGVGLALDFSALSDAGSAFLGGKK
jgi:hypothetical protein